MTPNPAFLGRAGGLAAAGLFIAALLIGLDRDQPALAHEPFHRQAFPAALSGDRAFAGQGSIFHPAGGPVRPELMSPRAEHGPSGGADTSAASSARWIQAALTVGALIWIGLLWMGTSRPAWRGYVAPVLLWGIAVAGTQVWAARSGTNPASPASLRAEPVDPEIVEGPFSFAISTAPAEETLVSRHLRLQGRVVPAPMGEVRVEAPAAGFITYPSSAPQVGQLVREGETLASFQHHFNLHDYVHLFNERWPVLREVLRAEREEVAARVAYERIQELAEFEVASRGEVLQHEARWRQSQAEAQAWAQRLELHDKQIQSSEPVRRPIVAPVTGIVAETRFSQGQLVYEGDPVVTLVNLAEVWVEGLAPLAEAGWIERAEASWVVLPGHRGEPLQARRRAVAPVVDGEARMLRLHYSLPNDDRLLRLNMSVDLLVNRGDEERAVTVPRSALLTHEQTAFVFVRVGPQRYARREVRVRGEDVHVLAVDGLAPGDEVVVGGHHQLWAIHQEGEGPALPAHAH